MIEKNVFSANPLEQFILLGKIAKGPACLELINQVLETPGIYVFGELLDMSNIKEVSFKVLRIYLIKYGRWFQVENSPNKKYWNTLNLFAYGTYSDYLQNKNNYLPLTPSQTKKLQHLTIVTLATKSKVCFVLILLSHFTSNCKTTGMNKVH